MNKNILKGNWNQIRGSVRDTWGKLTDDELDQIAGRRDKLIGAIQKKYGYAQEEVERQLDEFLKYLGEKIPA